MKTTILKISVIFLFFSLMGAGCEKGEERDPLCHQGMVIQLNRLSNCYDIIKILKTGQNSELQVGATISFNPELSEKKIKEGDVVYFKVIEFEKFEPQISTQPCSFPQFTASIEFCNI